MTPATRTLSTLCELPENPIHLHHFRPPRHIMALRSRLASALPTRSHFCPRPISLGARQTEGLIGMTGEAMQGLLQEQGGKLVPTGFSLLLFGREPRVQVPQAGLLGTIHYEDGTEGTRDFDGSAVEVPEQAIQWIKDKLPNPISRSQAKRKERYESCFELLLEGIVNALVHRDYGIEGATCQLSVTSRRAGIAQIQDSV